MDYQFLRDMKDDPRRLHHVSVDHDKCMGCQRCIHACCYDVYKWDKENKWPIAAYSEECVACLQCMYYCPSGAITVKQASLAFFDALYDPFGLNDVKNETEEG